MLYDVWVTTHDEGVCPDCLALNGKSWPHASGNPRPPLHPNCRCLLILEDREPSGDDEIIIVPPVIIPDPEPPKDPEPRNAMPNMPHSALDLDYFVQSEPITAHLSTVSTTPAGASTKNALDFEAVTFRAQYPNANYYRFREQDLPVFAGSFAGVPFLRDHDIEHIDARGGTVQGSRLEGSDLVQQIRLTVPRDIEAFSRGQIDRFSVSWYYTSVTCSVCGQDWLHSDCQHWPGKRYAAGAEGKQTALCELIFENPRGKEVSAVNAPAVAGTHIRNVLAQLSALKGTQPMTDPLNTANLDAAALLAAQRDAVLNYKLDESHLPPALQDVVRDTLAYDWRVADLDASIARQRAAWAKLEAQNVVTGHGTPRDARIAGMMDSQDRITEALTALIENRQPARGIPPLTGLKEAYFLLSGDYQMTGKFHGENVGLASVTSSTMADIVANAMNKIVVNSFQQYPRWWSPIVTEENFGTLQTVRWITLGGIGELPTVAEGAAYTELAWADNTETSAWTKKGGYLGITLEAMDKDDVSRLQTAPRALAQAAWLTLNKAVSGIFTTASGLGPTLTDTGTLFNATAVATPGGHANLGTTALSMTSWLAAKLSMRKQAELNSGERLGGLTSPRYLLVPPDLENTALTILASEGLPGTANNDVNPEARGNTFDARMDAAKRRVVVVDLWTDTNNWAAVADPLMYPSIGVGYRFGTTPEIFSVASPNSGLMFTNDVMPIKVRFFFAVGPTDFRGLYKANVT